MDKILLLSEESAEEKMNKNGMTERNDEIDNQVHDLLCTMANKRIDWNMELIGRVEECIEKILPEYNIHVCHPGFLDEGLLCNESNNCEKKKKGECKFV